ncbi:hypothetical protein AT574_02380 [Phaeobacter inhibens]|nr:hypothetical protein AT574_02380 [Phaeobacter inhibens]
MFVAGDCPTCRWYKISLQESPGVAVRPKAMLSPMTAILLGRLRQFRFIKGMRQDLLKNSARFYVLIKF